MAMLCSYLKAVGIAIDEISCVHILDAIIAGYLDHMFAEGEPKSYANATVAALQHFYIGTKRQLNWSWRYVGAWQRCEKEVRAKPFDFDLTLVVACWMLAKAYHSLCSVVLVGFIAFTRAGDLASVH